MAVFSPDLSRGGASCVAPEPALEAVQQNLVKVSLDTTAYSSKPGDPAEYGRINNRIARGGTTLPLETLIERICAGHAFAPAVFRGGKRNRESWVGQQLFGLDFDKGLTLEQFEQISATYDVRPVFVYPTYSHRRNGNGDRFRAVFQCEHVVEDIRVAIMTIKLLARIFTTRSGGPDSACLDPTRLFLGTNDGPLLTLPSNRINPVDALIRYLHAEKRRDKSHYAAARKDLLKYLEIGTLSHHGYAGHAEPEPDSPPPRCAGSDAEARDTAPSTDADMSLTWRGDEVFKIVWAAAGPPRPATPRTVVAPCVDVSASRCSPQPKRQLTKTDKQALLRECRQLRELMSGERYLHHNERRILVTNLRQFKGGAAWYTEGLGKHHAHADDDWVAQSEYYKYKPEGCAKCAYATECGHKKNLLQHLPLRRRACRAIETGRDTYTLEESAVRLDHALEEVIEARDARVHVIRADTGVGKTEVLLRQPLGLACVAFPTHRLKREAHDRYLKSGRDGAYLWPEPPVLPAALAERYARYQTLGLPGSSRLVEEALYDPEVCEDWERVQGLHEYLDSLKRVHSQDLVFATHAKALRLEQPERYVFDEDPLKALLCVRKIARRDIDAVCRCAAEQGQEADRAFLERALNLPCDTPHVLSPGEVTKTSLQKLMAICCENLTTPVSSLVDAACVIKPQYDADDGVYTIERENLRHDATYVILSATVSEWIYRKLFGERLNFVDLSGTKLKGRLHLHMERSHSKQSVQGDLDGFVKQVGEDVKRYELEGVITHKFAVPALEAAGVPIVGWFEALEGLDAFGGKNLGVYGTPHLPEYALRLYAHALDLPCDAEDFVWKERVLTRNGFEFSFTTCSDRPELQELQISLIESTLSQAVGRARLVRNDCEVRLFSRLPLAGGVLVECDRP